VADVIREIAPCPEVQVASQPTESLAYTVTWGVDPAGRAELQRRLDTGELSPEDETLVRQVLVTSG
jgi:hypothetical protein